MALAAGSLGCRVTPSEPPEAEVKVRVPRTAARLRLDGRLVEEDWRRSGRGGVFADPKTGQPARPYSEVRFLWDDRRLYVGLYAADQDIRTGRGEPSAADDAFWLRVPAGGGGGNLVLVLRPRGDAVGWHELGDGRRGSAWRSGTVLGVDLDGTLDDPSDDDEEWVVEAAIPIAALGARARAGTRLRLGIERCDIPKGSRRRCGRWGLDARGQPTGVIELVGAHPT